MVDRDALDMALEAGHPAESARVYRVADVFVRIAASAAMLNEIDVIFSRIPRPRGEIDAVDITLAVHFADERHVIEGGGLASRSFPHTAPLGAVALELANAVAEAVCRISSFFVFHAAVLERDGMALALGGPSQAGKTTLAAHLMNRGWRLLSDEYAFVDANTERVVAFPKLMVVRAVSLPLLPRSFRGCCETSPWFALPHRHDAHFYAVDPARAYGESIWAKGAQLRRYVDLRRGTAAAAIEECETWSLAPQIQALTWPHVDLLTSMAKMGSAMRGVRSGILHYDAPARASDVLEDWFE
jgi:hypothetical protein